jgi:hypothetical protein
MAFDSARGVTVLFGGDLGAFYSNETWEWDGTTWTRRTTSAVPGRTLHSMAYDASRGVTEVFGGYVSGTSGDTYEYDGTDWVRRTISGPTRRQAPMCYDAVRQMCVLFGGYDSAGNSLPNNETWGLSLPCAAPLFASVQPLVQSVCTRGSAPFFAISDGTGPLTYQWQVKPPGASSWTAFGSDPAQLPCGPGSAAHATPASAAAVTIGITPCVADRTTPQQFHIRCTVSNDCGSSISSEATYSTCPPDFNCSGSVEVQDIFDFLDAWFAGDPSADFNGLDGVQIQDIFDFLNAWFAGC